MLNYLMQLVFKIVLFAAGLIFATILLVFAIIFAALWGLRALWARLTGQPVRPWVMRISPRDGWRKVYRAGQGDAAQATHRKRDTLKDVTDVEVK